LAVAAVVAASATQKYIHSLGFGETRRPIDNRPQAVRINQLGADNSFATDAPKNELRFGKGGVDDAEDAEVILHEYATRFTSRRTSRSPRRKPGRSARASPTTGP
jgi:zinc metalloprotease ZmpB